ncbi:Methyltransferase domain-containing protein [Butyrivibrio sp. Su6]|uniref:class I SAM-dependent methyltransferase n=1 Tax=Butyrivibrio sp. Su6 TaxID=1520810 RepID=UPI00089E6974|nr:class I SAM-dependent methyltransferase [Butyrivibrio sp. Su6]SEG17209.1 Methyltransferase domain-containing protein [Butyrivibrio sp. Su6]
MDLKFLSRDHFKNMQPEGYEKGWLISGTTKCDILQDDIFSTSIENTSWSTEIEAIHEVPTKNGWIDVYERKRVLQTAQKIISNRANSLIMEFGASSGYMIEEMQEMFPNNVFIATDLMNEGLKQSFKKAPNILHLRCDILDAPFTDSSIDFIYSLNVLEHIDNDKKAISECYRCVKPGGYCLFVVPRGDSLYDYFDEMLFHKRRYAKEELKKKCIDSGFTIKEDFHYAWLCYPLFWLKKKWNKFVGKRLSQEEKIERVKADIDAGMSSRLAIGMMYIENLLSKHLSPSFGVREFILCLKE